MKAKWEYEFGAPSARSASPYIYPSNPLPAAVFTFLRTTLTVLTIITIVLNCFNNFCPPSLDTRHPGRVPAKCAIGNTPVYNSNNSNNHFLNFFNLFQRFSMIYDFNHFQFFPFLRRPTPALDFGLWTPSSVTEHYEPFCHCILKLFPASLRPFLRCLL